MVRILRSPIGGMVYHILNRANGRETIFQREEDYKVIGKILFEAKKKYSIQIFSFCIMPNHWHFVLCPKEGKDLPNFMRWITHTHTQRWHTYHQTVGCGHVYQGRYKSFPVEKDSHFLLLCRYVERNPLRAKLVQKAEGWEWSSLWTREHGTEQQKSLLSPWPVERPNSYIEWVNTPLINEERDLKKIRHALQRGRPYGREDWVDKTAKESGLLSTLKPRGRPRKGT
jgi:putative transposase